MGVMKVWDEVSQQYVAVRGNYVDPTRETYTHVQESPATTWTVTHNLSKHPSVTIQDMAYNQIHGEVQYLDLNTVQIRFEFSITGRADCN